MTEQQWLASTDPAAMFRAIDPRNARIASKDSPLWKFKPSDRRLRLFACAVCRQPDVWSRLVDDAPCGRCGGSGVIHPRTYCPDCNDNGKGVTPGRVSTAICECCVGLGGHIRIEDEDRAEPANAMSKSDYQAGRNDQWRRETPTNWSPCDSCSGTGRINRNRSRRAVEVAERFADDGSECDAEYMRLAYSDPSQRGSFEEELATLTCGSVSAMMANSGLPRWFSVSNKHAARQADLLRHIVGNPWRPVGSKKCRRCEGDGKAHGSDRPFEWSADVDYGKCVVCKGNGWIQELQPEHRTPLVLDLAQQLYDGADVAPVLHDALIDAGAPEELAGHFMEPCPHCKDAGFTHGDYGGPLVNKAVIKHLNSKCACGGSRLRYGTHPKGCWAVDLLLGKE